MKNSYWLTPWSRVLFEKLTCFLLVNIYPAFYGTRRLINTFTSALVPILSQFDPFHIPSSHFLKIHLNIILTFTPGSHILSLSFWFPHQKPVYASLLPISATCPTNLILLDFSSKLLGEEYYSLSSSLRSFPRSPVTTALLGLFSTPSAYVPPSVWTTNFHTHIKQQAMKLRLQMLIKEIL